MGVSWKDAAGKMKGTDQLLLDMAERFSTMPDGIEKTAMATKVFGKAGMDLIPFLNQGKDGIKELMDEAEKLGIVLDAKTAAASEALNDNLTRLETSTRGLMVQAIAPLIPFLSAMSDEMVKTRKEGEGASRWSQLLTNALRIVGVRRPHGEDSLREPRQHDWRHRRRVGCVLLGRLRARGPNHQTDARGQPRRNAEARRPARLAVGRLHEGAEKAKVATKGVGDSAIQSAADLDKFQKVLDKITGKSNGMDASFFSDLKVLFEGYQKGNFGKGAAGLEAYRKVVEQLIAQQPYLKKQLEDQVKAMEATAKIDAQVNSEIAAMVKQGDDLVLSLGKENEEYAFQTSLIGKTTLERELAILAHQKEIDVKKDLTGERRKDIETLYATKEALVRCAPWPRGSRRSSRRFATS
jgi:hypothetical protein